MMRKQQKAELCDGFPDAWHHSLMRPRFTRQYVCRVFHLTRTLTQLVAMDVHFTRFNLVRWGDYFEVRAVEAFSYRS